MHKDELECLAWFEVFKRLLRVKLLSIHRLHGKCKLGKHTVHNTSVVHDFLKCLIKEQHVQLCNRVTVQIHGVRGLRDGRPSVEAKILYTGASNGTYQTLLGNTFELDASTFFSTNMETIHGYNSTALNFSMV
jgi:hypothetical protein